MRELIKRLKIESATINLPGISFELGLKEKEIVNIQGNGVMYLKDLYILRNILSKYYFLYQQKYEELLLLVSDEDAIFTELTLDSYENTISTYKDIADLLLGSDYFLLLDSRKRNEIIASFDYVYRSEAYLLANADNELYDGDIDIMIKSLFDLLEEVNKAIEQLESN